MYSGRLLPHHIQHLHRLFLRPAPGIYSSKLAVEDAPQGDSDFLAWVGYSVSDSRGFEHSSGIRLTCLAIM